MRSAVVQTMKTGGLMKRALFIIATVLMFVPANADDITPTAGTSWYESLTYSVQPEPIKDWWQGGRVRLLSLGGIQGALPDAASVFDLYENGISSAVFQRGKKDILNITAGISSYLSRVDINDLKSGDDLLKYWLSDNDYISLNLPYRRGLSAGVIESYFISVDIAYARKFNETFAAGIRIKLSDLSYKEYFDEEFPGDIYHTYSGNDLEWQLDATWPGGSYIVFSRYVRCLNAFSIGNMRTETLASWPIEYYYELPDAGASITDRDIWFSSLREHIVNYQGIGAGYFFYFSDMKNEDRLTAGIRGFYDWKYHSMDSDSVSSYFNELNGSALHINMDLTARWSLTDFLYFAAVKRLALGVTWAKNSANRNTVSVLINQPLSLEIACFNKFIRIPLAYSDASGIVLKTGCEVTLFDCFSLRVGFSCPKDYFPGGLSISGGFGLNFDSFNFDFAAADNDEMLADLKYLF
jgi:hypothetical protein